jgi:hypothetical protein
VKCDCTAGTAKITMNSGVALTRRDVDAALKGTRFAVTSFRAPKATQDDKRAELVVWKVTYTRGGG